MQMSPPSGRSRRRKVSAPTSHAVVRAVLRGVRRSLGVAQAQKDALSIEQLHALVRVTVGRSGLLGLRDRALVLLGFAAALRRSRLVALAVEDLVEPSVRMM
jgi:site-specific recombinase XerC